MLKLNSNILKTKVSRSNKKNFYQLEIFIFTQRLYISYAFIVIIPVFNEEKYIKTILEIKKIENIIKR